MTSPDSPAPPLLRGVALAALGCLAACSSGGSGSDSGGTNLLTHQIGTQQGGLMAAGAADWDVEFLFDGQLDVDAEEYFLTTQNAYSVDSGALFGDLRVLVLDPWIVPIGQRARAGILRITRVATMEEITLEVDPTVGSAGGVHVTLDDGGMVTGPFTHDWETFEAILDAGGFEVFEEVAAYAYLGTVFALDRFELIIDAIASAFLNQADLDALGPGRVLDVDDVCGSLPGGLPGSLGVSWEDVNTDLELSDGDTIQVLFEECWCDRADRPDSLYSGTIVLSSIVGNENPFTALAIVELSGFLERRTEEVMTGVHEVVPGSDTTTDAVLFASFVE